MHLLNIKDVNENVKVADERLYKAKETGKNKIVSGIIEEHRCLSSSSDMISTMSISKES